MPWRARRYRSSDERRHSSPRRSSRASPPSTSWSPRPICRSRRCSRPLRCCSEKAWSRVPMGGIGRPARCSDPRHRSGKRRVRVGDGWLPGLDRLCYPDGRIRPPGDAGVSRIPHPDRPRPTQPGPVLRKYLIAILAVPVLLGVYASTALGRSRFIRGGVAIALGGIVALGAIASARPAVTTASPASDIVPLTQAAFRMAVATNIDLRAPASILFSAPMQRESVGSSVSIQPAVPFQLEWSADDTRVSIVPTGAWQPSTYYTVTVGA